MTEEHRLRRKQREELCGEHYACTPSAQFEQQTEVEEKRVQKAHEDRTCRIKIGESFSGVAYDKVRAKWEEQGLWNKRWTYFAVGKWKHEEPESEPETIAKPHRPLFGPRPKSKPKPTDEERERAAEIHKRQCEASRPFHQFVFQVSEERQRIQSSSQSTEYTDEINSTAYENVKNIWRTRKIWNEKWGVMPGMSWKHERPFKEVAAEHGLGPSPVPSLTDGSSASVHVHFESHNAPMLLQDNQSPPQRSQPLFGPALSPVHNDAPRSLRGSQSPPQRSQPLAPVHKGKVSKPKTRRKPSRQQQLDRSHQVAEADERNAKTTVPRRRSARVQQQQRRPKVDTAVSRKATKGKR